MTNHFTDQRKTIRPHIKQELPRLKEISIFKRIYKKEKPNNKMLREVKQNLKENDGSKFS